MNIGSTLCTPIIQQCTAFQAGNALIYFTRAVASKQLWLQFGHPEASFSIMVV